MLGRFVMVEEIYMFIDQHTEVYDADAIYRPYILIMPREDKESSFIITERVFFEQGRSKR